MNPSLALAFATAVSVALGLPTEAATTCKRLPDSYNSVLSFMKKFGDKGLFGYSDQSQELLTAFTTIDKELPWMSKCLGSIDPVSVYATVALSSGFSSCNASYAGVKDTFSLPDDLANDQALRERVCPFYGATAMPCLNNLVIQALVDSMTSTGTCCDDMKAAMQKQFGTNRKTVVADLLNKFGAAVCTIKTFRNTAGKSTTQTCLTSMLESFVSSSASDNLELLVQLPTDQACKAMAGQKFTTSRAETVQFNWKDLSVESFGICYEPLS